eukprot:11083761-Karenia_brevis.AAC.1
MSQTVAELFLLSLLMTLTSKSGSSTRLSTLFDARLLPSSEPWCIPPVTGAFRMHRGRPEARLRDNSPQSPP